jgi:hypothetical protein
MLIAAAATLVACSDDAGTPVSTTGTAALAGPAASLASDAHAGELYELQSAFHAAVRNGDEALLRTLWAEDAVLHAAGSAFEGRDAIIGFFKGTPQYQNHWAALTALYKTSFDRHGETVSFQFECIFLEDDPVDLTGNEILLHLNARGVAKKVGTRWVFQMVQGGAGAL